ncbi:hypothetical protein L1987_88943 [Smallanthus sonchifolius]|nr:hypothetical protein L1987_88943 [Smallanthus sonchifolius]
MGTLDDMNHLQNKRIRSVADLLQEQFGLALVRLENMARGNIYAALKHNWDTNSSELAAGNSLALNQGIQEEQVVPARYRQEFLTIAWEQVHLRSIFAFQYFSIGASLIPFIEHNDANRALMSSNMQRQAVPSFSVREVHCWNWIGGPKRL